MLLVLASYWPGRDNEGCRLPEYQYVAYIQEKIDKGDMSPEMGCQLLQLENEFNIIPPKQVRGTSRLLIDLKTLEKLTSHEISSSISA